MFQTPQNDQKMHLKSFLEPLRRGLSVISLVLALKFWSKIDIFHRYLYSDFLKIFSKSAKNRIFWSNFIRKPLIYSFMVDFLWNFTKKFDFWRILKNFWKNHSIGTCEKLSSKFHLKKMTAHQGPYKSTYIFEPPIYWVKREVFAHYHFFKFRSCEPPLVQYILRFGFQPQFAPVNQNLNPMSISYKCRIKWGYDTEPLWFNTIRQR